MGETNVDPTRAIMHHHPHPPLCRTHTFALPICYSEVGDSTLDTHWSRASGEGDDGVLCVCSCRGEGGV